MGSGRPTYAISTTSRVFNVCRLSAYREGFECPQGVCKTYMRGKAVTGIIAFDGRLKDAPESIRDILVDSIEKRTSDDGIR